MKKSTKINIIVVILFLELAWAFQSQFYMHGQILDEPYRNAERRTVLFEWIRHPTPETKSAYDAEVTILHRHMLQVAVAFLIGGLVFDAVGIYLLRKYVPTKTSASMAARKD